MLSEMTSAGIEPAQQASLSIRPGMQAEVELHTGGKTILTYLTKPLYRGSEALRER